MDLQVLGSSLAQVEATKGHLTRKNRRRLGLLNRHLVGYAIQAGREGVDLAAMSDDERIAYLIACASDAHPEGWADPQLDWSGMAEFFAAIMPFLLQLFALFA